MCADNGITAPLVVTDAGTAGLDFVAALLKQLWDAGLRCSIYAASQTNPTDAAIIAGARCYRDWDADGIVALGGGSGLDAGKAVALIAAQSRAELWSFDFNGPVIGGFKSGDFPPVICVPTTAGTGAETESTAMITNTLLKTKGCVWHPLARPVAVILDPELTLGLPRDLTAWTGVDAMIHALEAWFVPSFNPLCDGIALQALTLIWEALPLAVMDGANLEARGKMLAGACLAGVAFGKGLGLVHALSHMIGATYNTHHGLTNAILLPVVLRFNRSVIESRIVELAHAMRLPKTDFDTFYSAICARLDDLDIPKNLAALGIEKTRVGDIAAKAMRDPARATNPQTSNQMELEHLLIQAIDEARS
jgi:alcohol dehydrogenase class IV